MHQYWLLEISVGCKSQASLNLTSNCSIFRKYRKPPSNKIMELWRQRVGDCIGFDWDRSVQSTPPTIVVIDRQWNASRHIININHVMATLKSHYPKAHVELHYLEGLNLKQQAVIYNRASVVLWVHGASMANLIFLPRRAVGLHIVPRPHIQENLDWPEELVRDLSHDVSSALLSTTSTRRHLSLCQLYFIACIEDCYEMSDYDCMHVKFAPCFAMADNLQCRLSALRLLADTKVL